jgi:hypothetical protein
MRWGQTLFVRLSLKSYINWFLFVIDFKLTRNVTYILIFIFIYLSIHFFDMSLKITIKFQINHY